MQGMVGFYSAWTEQVSILTMFWMSPVQNVHHVHYQLHIHQSARFGFFWFCFCYGEWNVDWSLCCETRDKAETDPQIQQKGKVLQNSNAPSQIEFKN